MLVRGVAKNKGTYRSQREDKPAEAMPETALAQQTESFFTRHRSKVLVATGLLAVVMIGLSIYRWRNGKRETAATGLFDQTLQTLGAQVGEAPSPELAMPGDEPPLTFATGEARSTAALAVLDQLDRDYGSTKVDQHVRLVRAGVLSDLGRYDDAEKIYRSAVSAALPEVLRLVAREGLARTLESKALQEKDDAARKAGLEAALAEYKKVQPDQKGLWRDSAIYNEARVMVLVGDVEGAKARFKELVDTMPASPFTSDANERLAALR